MANVMTLFLSNLKQCANDISAIAAIRECEWDFEMDSGANMYEWYANVTKTKQMWCIRMGIKASDIRIIQIDLQQ